MAIFIGAVLLAWIVWLVAAGWEALRQGQRIKAFLFLFSSIYAATRLPLCRELANAWLHAAGL